MMRSSVQLIITVVFVTVIFLFSNATAQEMDEGNYFTVTTWKLSIPENGSTAELKGLFKEFHEKVTLKNDKVISSRILRHVSGHDFRDWVVIEEYASWADIGAAMEKQNELIDQAWPDENERAAFFKKFGKYSVTHSDEIIQELPEFTK